MFKKLFGSGSSEPEVTSPKPDIRKDVALQLAEALQAYRAEFHETLSTKTTDAERDAQELVKRAHRMVADTGLGPALAPTLLEEVKHWDAWSKRPDFQQWVHFPATDVVAKKDRAPNAQKETVTTVNFVYAGQPYGVVFRDQGISSFADDSHHHAKVEFLSEGRTVLGLNISLDLADEWASWRWINVFACRPGDWMKHLVEIATHIEASRENRSKEYSSNDVIERAKNIEM